MAKVRVILKQKVRYPTGTTLKIYGHEFIVQKDGMAAAMVDESFLKNEIAASRYILAEDIAQQEAPELDTRYVDSFGYDIGQYYGAGSLEKLKEKISKLRKDELTFFAKTRLGKEFPFTTGKSRMVFEVIEVIRTKNESQKIEVKKDEQAPQTELKNKNIDQKAQTADASKSDPNQMMFSFVAPEEKAAGLGNKPLPPIKQKSRDELMAELNELEKLAEQRKEKAESKGTQ